MEGWMEGWMDGWMDGWLGINISPEDGWMDGWMDGWLVINISPENEHRMYSTTYFSQSMFKTNTCQKRVISVRLKINTLVQNINSQSWFKKPLSVGTD